ncbi:hypothetical protein [Nannocystis punicea]|uniref:Uncharacterized protein n=1 Tax=Nannocystis punicea TaxID=2995304 RepID=A0ABY7H9W8_9BACT|nr:hypothetical protein [Nannocystis poenicansa]WAS95897.1 hypothetical protein O0S08_07010 [Nannocystis poenicansa]
MLDDALAIIRARPNMYFRDAPQLASGLVDEALSLGCQHVHVLAPGERWIVMASTDWFQFSNTSVRALFERIVPFTQSPPNGMWLEVVLTAFCDEVATWTQTDALVVRGAEASWSPIWEDTRRSFPDMRRFVAFTSPHQ